MNHLNQALAVVLITSSLFSCDTLYTHSSPPQYREARNPENLFQALGGIIGIEGIADELITQIEYSPTILPYFENSDIGRFKEKFLEHICFLANGPCNYTGDSMKQVHGGMDVTETDFNQLVDLLIDAMNKNQIKHTTQNRLLRKLIPLRENIIYQ